MQAGLIEKFVHPGEMLFGDRGTRILTILGSCVAIVAWHPALLVGGLSHYMLPGRRRKPRQELNGRYSEDALELLAREFRKLDAGLGECQIKLFGGGNMFPADQHLPTTSMVSRKNIDAAHRLMHDHNLQPRVEHVGGNGYRKLTFDVASGEVWMRYSPLKAVAA